MPTPVKRIDIKEFWEFGFLQELNRQFLHPLGLALEIVLFENGDVMLGGIWDYRDNLEGMIFVEGEIDQEKIKRVAEFAKEKHNNRNKSLGYIIQEK